MATININQWLKEESFKVANDLITICNDNSEDDQFSAFGMKTKVYELIENLKGALYPNIYKIDVGKNYIENSVQRRITDCAINLNQILSQLFFCFGNDKENAQTKEQCQAKAEELTISFLSELPNIRKILTTDISAAYDGDPAAKSYEDIIISYPCIEAITIYRMANYLFNKDVPLLPRIMTEYAHSKTGIDIHPGATIGEYFFIDHGTGVVIGETCIIGHHVKLYQGVTLGAKSFTTDEAGSILNIKRHPNIEDNVTIYSGATILGGDTTVGEGSIIGGNVWLTDSVPADSKVYNSTPSPFIK